MKFGNRIAGGAREGPFAPRSPHGGINGINEGINIYHLTNPPRL